MCCVIALTYMNFSEWERAVAGTHMHVYQRKRLGELELDNGAQLYVYIYIRACGNCVMGVSNVCLGL